MIQLLQFVAERMGLDVHRAPRSVLGTERNNPLVSTDAAVRWLGIAARMALGLPATFCAGEGITLRADEAGAAHWVSFKTFKMYSARRAAIGVCWNRATRGATLLRPPSG